MQLSQCCSSMAPYYGAHLLGLYCNTTSPHVHQLPCISCSTMGSSSIPLGPASSGALPMLQPPSGHIHCCTVGSFTVCMWRSAPPCRGTACCSWISPGQPAGPWTSPELLETYVPHLVYLLPSLCTDVGGCMSVSPIVFYSFSPSCCCMAVFCFSSVCSL